MFRDNKQEHIPKGVIVGWVDSIEHSRWLSSQMQALLGHGHAAVTTTGFGYYAPFGMLDKSKPVDLTITAKMTYVYSLGSLMGIPGSRRFSDHGLACLRKYFLDPEHGGWFTGIKHHPDSDGHGVPWDEQRAEKWQFPHSALILAAAAATVANRPGAHELLRDALQNQEEHWLEEGNGLVRDTYSRDWSHCRDYRSLNSLVHTVEAYLAAAEATNDTRWIDKAEIMLDFVAETGPAFDWRIPENYRGDWTPDPDYNRDAPDTSYHPYGVLIGHGMQLSRLAVQTRAALRSLGREEPPFLLSMAAGLFERARVDGWYGDENPGFVCSTNFEGEPVIRKRMQWVVCEAICAAVSLRRATLDDDANVSAVEVYEHCYHSWLDYLNDYMMVEPGVFVRMLDADNRPLAETLPSRPDIYHSLQALLIARVPLWPPFAAALSRNLLDAPGQPPPDKKSWRFFR